MSGTVEELIEKLEQLPEVVKKAAEKAIEDDEFEILEINRQQMLDGFGADGKPFGEYAASSKTRRQKKGLQTEHIDLKFTGRFQRGLEINKTGDLSYEMTSNDPKWEQRLQPQARFENAIGIDDKNGDKVVDIIAFNIETAIDELF